MKGIVGGAEAHDVSRPLATLDGVPLHPGGSVDQQGTGAPAAPPGNPAGAGVEQRKQGLRSAAALVESFDGLGVGFEGPHGRSNGRSPSDNSLAVGPDHVFQIVNSRMAIFTRKGAKYDITGNVLYGAVPTNTIFAGFGGTCETRNNGDAVVRYDQPTSTGDNVIQKHACVADRERMLKGEPATEQCVIIDGVNFLSNADLDGVTLPPAGAPNIMMAAGGTQLHNDFDDDGIYAWSYRVDWREPANTRVTGPVKIPVAPYHYLCNGQLTACVPQPGTDRRLDAQGPAS